MKDHRSRTYNTVQCILLLLPIWFSELIYKIIQVWSSRVESFSRSSNLLKFHIHYHSYNLFLISSSSGVYNEPGNWQVTSWTNWLICSLLAQLIMALHRYRRGFYTDFNSSNPEHPSIHRETVINFGESSVTERRSWAGPISNRISVHTRKAIRYNVDMAYEIRFMGRLGSFDFCISVETSRADAIGGPNMGFQRRGRSMALYPVMDH